jgi:hypothetical protein
VPAIVALFVAPLAAEDNPLANAKKGDWVEYATTSKAGAFSIKNEQREEVAEKNGDSVTIEVSMKQNPQVKQSYTVKLSDKYDPLKLMRPSADFTSKETGKGEDELELAGKKIKASWTAYEELYDINGHKQTVKTKIWTAAGIPVGGVVKVELDLGAGGKKLKELSAFGSP